MSDNKKDDRLKPVPPDPDEKPEVYAVFKRKDGKRVTRRAFLGTLGAGVLAGAAGCAPAEPRATAVIAQITTT